MKRYFRRLGFDQITKAHINPKAICPCTEDAEWKAISGRTMELTQIAYCAKKGTCAQNPGEPSTQIVDEIEIQNLLSHTIREKNIPKLW